MRKNSIRWISFAAGAVLVISGYAIKGRADTKYAESMLDLTYQRAFQELASNVEEMDTALQKCILYSTPSMLSSGCTEAFGKALSAQTALAELPLGTENMEKTASFISKVGDYSYYLAKSTAAGKMPDDEIAKGLKSLSETASVLSNNIMTLCTGVSNGEIELYTAQKQADAALGSFCGDGFKMIESEFPEVASLIYDGPFSDHIAQMKPKFLEGKSSVSEDEALKKASEFTGLKTSIFTKLCEREGNLPVYVFSASVDGGEETVEVSKTGGVVITLLNSRFVASAALSPEEAVTYASDFLKAQGYEGMKESYYITNDNKTTVNFAATCGDVICYPDLIKVTVALDNGAIVGYESLGYVMSHKERQISEPTVDEETAKASVSRDLTVNSHALAIIPTAGSNEVMCHEFKCSSEDGRNYIHYVNCETGAEEKLLILIEDENGVLTR